MKDLDAILATTVAGDTITLDGTETYTTVGPWGFPAGINVPNGVTIHAGSAVIRLIPPPPEITRLDHDLPILRAGENVTIFGGTWDCNYLGCPGWFTQGIRFHGKFTVKGSTIIGMSGSKASGTPAGSVESFAISSLGDTGGSLVEDCIVRDCKVDSINDYVSGIFIGATVETETISSVVDCSVDLGVNGQFCYSSNQPTDFIGCEGHASRFWYNDTGPTRRCRIIDCTGNGNYAVIDCIASPGGTIREVSVIRGVFTGTRAVEWWDKSGGLISGGVISTEVDYSNCQYYLSSAGDHGTLMFDRCNLGSSTAVYATDASVRAIIVTAPVPEPVPTPPPVIPPAPSGICIPTTPTVPGNVVISVICEPDDPCSGGGTGSPEWYSSCRNPLWALDHQTECGPLSITSIQLDPSTLAIAYRRSGQLRVIARFSDGRTADVTGESAFTVLNAPIARHIGSGIISGDAVGSSGISAYWRGYTAVGAVSVFDNACALSRFWDVVPIIDDGGYYIVSTKAMFQGVTNVVVPAFRRLYAPIPFGYAINVLALQLSMDLFANGVFDPATGWNPYAPNPDRNNVGGVRTGKDRIWTGTAWSDSVSPIPLVGSSDVGGLLMQAFAAHQQGRPDARKLIVLYSMGGETKCTPSISAAAAAVKAAGIEIVVITSVKPYDPIYSMCDYPDTAHSVLAAAASECLFVDGVAGGGHLSNAYATVLNAACNKCTSADGIGINLL